MTKFVTMLNGSSAEQARNFSSAELIRRRYVSSFMLASLFLCGVILSITHFLVPLEPVGQRLIRDFGILLSLGALLAYVVLWISGKRVLALNLFIIALALGIARVTLLTGGITAPSTIMLVVVPVLASVSIDLLAGLLWLAIVTVFWTLVYLAPTLEIPVENVMASENREIGVFISCICTALLAMFATGYYERSNAALRRKLQSEHALAVYHGQHDPLTGLMNRRFFVDTVKSFIADPAMKGFCILYLDLNAFKPINDNYGHHVGDEVLMAIGRRLRECFRGTDSCCRIGGDEFCVLVPVGEQSPITDVVKRASAIFSEPVVIEGRELAISASIGSAVFPADGKTYEELLHSADQQMYRVKKAK
ncbi:MULTISPECIES: GGDEF domain-containing protein [Spongiibacter]|uniref:GGDEF domain-containing protein n=1 Tax=Spongiibacter TaxID=630749 RepID=UPI002357F3C7|nr:MULTISPECIES: GGDEF domain-containing protein [Spongiibacter]|tara:strand:- start:7115 stop:8206 length:1092 start_codon:yes stop_codon:yes gene_type:complete